MRHTDMKIDLESAETWGCVLSLRADDVELTCPQGRPINESLLPVDKRTTANKCAGARSSGV